MRPCQDEALSQSVRRQEATTVALPLLAIRLPGTVLALVLMPDVCFTELPLVPSPEGQYLLKDLAIFSAAMVIGGTVRDEPRGGAEP